MTPEIFNKITAELFQKCMTLLDIKREEYSGTTDRLFQFKRIAGFTRETPEKVLLGMWLKHVSSIVEYVEQERQLPVPKWEEKILDSINYMALLYAIIIERNPAYL